MAWYISGDGHLKEDCKEQAFQNGATSYKFTIIHNHFTNGAEEVHFYNVQWITNRRPGTIDKLLKGAYVSVRGAEFRQRKIEDGRVFYDVTIKSGNQITVKPKIGNNGSYQGTQNYHQANPPANQQPQAAPQAAPQPAPQGQNQAVPPQQGGMQYQTNPSQDMPQMPQQAPQEQAPQAPPGGVNVPGPSDNPYEG